MSLHVIIFKIFTYLDYDSLVNAEKVSTQWRLILADELIWYWLLWLPVVKAAMSFL